MKKLKLTQGYEMLIDDGDVALFEGWSLRAQRGPWGTYAMCRRKGGKAREIGAHRLILNAPPDKQVDHINGNKLDNRRKNIRLCTVAENGQNRGSQKNNAASGFKGVTWDGKGPKRRSPWKAMIQTNRKRICIGYFSTAELAAQAYDKKATELHGAFARLNFPGLLQG